MSDALQSILQLPKDERLRIAMEILRSIQVDEKQTEAPLVKDRALRGYGKFAGQIWMSNDFDAPLDDFKDYM